VIRERRFTVRHAKIEPVDFRGSRKLARAVLGIADLWQN
jgi:hypothetical protein